MRSCRKRELMRRRSPWQAARQPRRARNNGLACRHRIRRRATHGGVVPCAPGSISPGHRRSARGPPGSPQATRCVARSASQEFRSRHLGRFRPPLRSRDALRRGGDRRSRHQTCASTCCAVDGSPPRSDRLAFPAGIQPAAAAAARRRRNHRSVELSAEPEPHARRHGVGGWQPGHDQAERTGAEVFGLPERGGDRVFQLHGDRRGGGGPGDLRELRGAASSIICSSPDRHA